MLRVLRLCAPRLEGAHLPAMHRLCYDHAISLETSPTVWIRTRELEEPALYGNEIIRGQSGKAVRTQVFVACLRRGIYR